MDRLQLAIKKAREERQSGGIRPDAKAQSVVGSGADEVAVRAPATTPVQQENADQWLSFKPMDINKSLLHRNRIMTYEGGTEAAPFDMLRTKMLQQMQKNNWRRVAIVSPDSGCGKSTVAASLAFSFARQKDIRSVVMDLDLRRVGLANYLQQKCSHGMGDVLESRVRFEDHALRSGENLLFGLNDGPARNSSEILQSRRTVEVLEEIENRLHPDIVMFDVPPLMASDDSHGFLKNVDCALLVIAAEKTTFEQVDVAERQLADLTNVLGIVLNKCRYTGGAYGYEYGYY